MKDDTLFPEDLSVLARRGEASAPDERRLDMLRGASPVESWLHEAGQDFDRLPDGGRADRALLDRAVRGALDVHTAPQRRRRRPLRTAAIVALASFVTFGAAALTLPFVREANDEAAGASCASCPGPAAPAPSARGAQQMTSEAEQVSEAPAREATEPPSPGAQPAEKPSGTQPARVDSAAELFSSANALRGAGRTTEAIAAYRRLQSKYPRSAEATLSYVVVGRLFLQRGAASDAHEQFARYSQLAPGGSLAEEALHGQATALRLSGRTAEERRVHQRLLARYPNSPYARSARERLEELR